MSVQSYYWVVKDKLFYQITVAPILHLHYTHGTRPGSDNLKGRLKRVPKKICKKGKNKYRNIEFPT
jgi:hypothetical protein